MAMQEGSDGVYDAEELLHSEVFPERATVWRRSLTIGSTSRSAMTGDGVTGSASVGQRLQTVPRAARVNSTSCSCG